eukprot:TRINITY_DN5372_c0_g1_i4.p2 TRINITY_DN5372_c0_g1~~TRINITY_DN5372_c0_g1_i4.p2  ORF type:complete len:269 (+),score=49.43 TRINITY_DN5372_c0_g1_i4:72-809(+)
MCIRDRYMGHNTVLFRIYNFTNNHIRKARDMFPHANNPGVAGNPNFGNMGMMGPNQPMMIMGPNGQAMMVVPMQNYPQSPAQQALMMEEIHYQEETKCTLCLCIIMIILEFITLISKFVVASRAQQLQCDSYEMASYSDIAVSFIYIWAMLLILTGLQMLKVNRLEAAVKVLAIDIVLGTIVGVVRINSMSSCENLARLSRLPGSKLPSQNMLVVSLVLQVLVYAFWIYTATSSKPKVESKILCT